MNDNYFNFFPWEEYRPNQKEAIERISKSIEDKEHLMFCAPCGFGKSISTICATLKNNKKIIIVTPNHATRAAHTTEVLLINKNRGSKYTVIELKSKKDMCLNFRGDNSFSAERCTTCRKYEKDCQYYFNLFPEDAHDKSDLAIETLIEIKQKENCCKEGHSYLDKHLNSVMYEEIDYLCQKNTLCFYYLMQERIKKADVIILDYNWIISGSFQHLTRLLGDLSNYVLLIDEADMLIERASKGIILDKGRISKLIGSIQKIYSKLDHRDKIPDKSLEYLTLLRETFDGLLNKYSEEKEINISEFYEFINKTLFPVNKFIVIINKIIDMIKDDEDTSKVSSRPESLLKKIEELIAEKKEHGYILYKTKDKYGKWQLILKSILLKYSLLENKLTLEEIFKKFNNAILFSATLNRILIEINFGFGFHFEYYDVNYNKKDFIGGGLKTIIYTGLSSGRTKKITDTPKYQKLLFDLNNIHPGILAGITSNIELKKWGELDNFKILKEEKDKVSNNRIYLIGLHQKESRSINSVGKLSTALCVGYPLSSHDFDSPTNINLYIQKQNRIIKEEYGAKISEEFMHYKVITKAIQFIGRTTRNIWQHKRLIVLAEERFLNYVDLFPNYIKDSIVILNEYNLVLEHAKTFWEKQ